MSKIIFNEGDMCTFKGTLPASLNMTGKIVKIQVRTEAGSKVIMDFSSANSNGLLQIEGHQITWIIPGSLSVGKAGKYQWQAVIYSTVNDPVRTRKDVFEIRPSIAII